MKANELMIGDFVLAFGVIRVVTLIHERLLPGDLEYISTIIPGHGFPDTNLSFRSEYAHPVPLTSEIFEKNGFERLGTDYILMGQPFGLTNPSSPDYYKDNYWLRVAATSVNIKFVHELQHALKLCGIEKEITI